MWLVMLLTRIDKIQDAISPFKAMLPAKLQMCIKVKISFFNERFYFAMFLLLGEKIYIFLYMIAAYTELTNSLAMVKEC